MRSTDDFRHQGMRRKLVALLKEKGSDNEAVLSAIGKVPRHLFIDDSAFQMRAYEDTAFPIPCGQTISQPYTVAFQTALLNPRPGQRILEVGTGSGYQTAVLSAMGARVFSIERHKPLYLQTKERLMRLGYTAAVYHGDGFAGLPREAPFDGILVTCGAPFVPPALVDQLKTGAPLIIPVGEGEVQQMQVLTKAADGSLQTDVKGNFRFVPMLAEKAK
ncbi:MAG TPA: protein-L-isoaspartate(D-aspartate) O-methyltransferase [Flavobacteriales bacterium]|nr:protein-L-isoaspartate(D-aspartate) O-methyltransferase [Flavobacteriales bacterium]